MIEWFVGSAVVVAVAAGASKRRPRHPIRFTSIDPDLLVRPDLPCPWCGGPTTEDDRACISCGQHFG